METRPGIDKTFRIGVVVTSGSVADGANAESGGEGSGDDDDSEGMVESGENDDDAFDGSFCNSTVE